MEVNGLDKSLIFTQIGKRMEWHLRIAEVQINVSSLLIILTSKLFLKFGENL